MTAPANAEEPDVRWLVAKLRVAAKLSTLAPDNADRLNEAADMLETMLQPQPAPGDSAGMDTNTETLTPIKRNRDEVVAEAIEYFDASLITGYKPFDRDAHLGERPWTDRAAIEKWEAGHGHDVRTKCYAEYGCAAIESQAMAIIGDLLGALERRPS